MTYVIGSACIDVADRSCTDVCPVDCIYEGDRKMYINPKECIDCGACAPECPVEAITLDRRTPEDERAFIDDNAAFFTLPLANRATPLGPTPGGATGVGRVGADTPMVTSF